MVSVSSKIYILFSISLLILFSIGPTIARNSHIITFRSSNLFPESIIWDQTSQHFVVGSLRHPAIHTVSDAGVVETLIHDTDLPANISIGGITIDFVNCRLLAVIHAFTPLPPFDALAAYDLRTRKRLFLAPLTDDVSFDRPLADDVTVDFKGNAFVTNSIGNLIWKVNDKGEPSIFSRSSIFSSQQVEADKHYSFCGLNGIAYISKGYLLVVQTNTGKMFKVDADDGEARLVLLNKNLTAADGIAIRGDGVVVVVSHHTAWLLKSNDSWGEGVVYDEISLDVEKYATSVAVRNDNKRVYVLYGYVNELRMGNMEREEFRIEEIESAKESEEDKIWIYILIGFGFAYFMYWRFQMAQLGKNMNKKTA